MSLNDRVILVGILIRLLSIVQVIVADWLVINWGLRPTPDSFNSLEHVIWWIGSLSSSNRIPLSNPVLLVEWSPTDSWGIAFHIGDHDVQLLMSHLTAACPTLWTTLRSVLAWQHVKSSHQAALSHSHLFMSSWNFAFRRATVLAFACIWVHALQKLIFVVSKLFDMFVCLLKSLSVLFSFALFSQCNSSCVFSAYGGLRPLNLLDLRHRLSTERCHRTIEHGVQVGDRIEIGSLGTRSQNWMHVPVDLALVDKNLLHPVVALGAVETVLLTFICLFAQLSFCKHIQPVSAPFPRLHLRQSIRASNLVCVNHIDKPVDWIWPCSCHAAFFSNQSRACLFKWHLAVKSALTYRSWPLWLQLLKSLRRTVAGTGWVSNWLWSRHLSSQPSIEMQVYLFNAIILALVNLLAAENNVFVMKTGGNLWGSKNTLLHCRILRNRSSWNIAWGPTCTFVTTLDRAIVTLWTQKSFQLVVLALKLVHSLHNWLQIAAVCFKKLFALDQRLLICNQFLTSMNALFSAASWHIQTFLFLFQTGLIQNIQIGIV